MAVTHNPAGFTGTVDQVDEARRFALGGGGRFRVNGSGDWALTADGAATRTVNIAAGSAVACGVYDTTTAVEPVPFLANSGGTDRFDAIVARFDWSTMTVQFTVVSGTTVPPVIVRTGGVVDNAKITWLPGLRYDAVLAVIRVRPNVTILAPADLYDCRPWGSWSMPNVTTATYRALIDSEPGARLRDNSTGTRYESDGTTWTVIGGQSKVGAVTVSTNASGDFTVTHDLGVVPTGVFVQGRTAGVLGGHMFAVTAKTATTFTARAYYNNSANNGTSIPIFYEVVA